MEESISNCEILWKKCTNMIYLGQRRGDSLCDKFWLNPLHTEVSEESRTNKTQIYFETYLLFLNIGIYYNILHTKELHL